MKKLTQEELLMVEELQQHLSGETYTVLMEEDTSEKEKYREAKREFIRKCSQLFVVDGAEFLCGPHRGILKGGVAWNTIDDNPSATEKECKKENFTFQDGFQVLSIGKWSRLSETTTLEDAIPLLFRSTIQIIGKMPGNTPTETYNLKFVTAGQNFVFEDTTDEEYEREVLGEEQKSMITNAYYTEGKVEQNLTLILTTEITGYACQRIKGETRDINSEDETIAVPTYKMEMRRGGKLLGFYNVTRDAWFSRGVIGGSRFLINDNDIELVNLSFEPEDAKWNRYYLVPKSYQGEDCYALFQKDHKGKLKDSQLRAVSHEEKMQHYPNGKKFDEARANPAIAVGVMLHMGGWYNNGSEDRLGASLGCFGIVPKRQVKSKGEIEELCKTKGYEDFELGNEDYSKAIRYIVKESKDKRIYLVIQKRSNVEKYRILHHQ